MDVQHFPSSSPARLRVCYCHLHSRCDVNNTERSTVCRRRVLGSLCVCFWKRRAVFFKVLSYLTGSKKKQKNRRLSSGAAARLGKWNGHAQYARKDRCSQTTLLHFKKKRAKLTLGLSFFTFKTSLYFNASLRVITLTRLRTTLVFLFCMFQLQIT